MEVWPGARQFESRVGNPVVLVHGIGRALLVDLSRQRDNGVRSAKPKPRSVWTFVQRDLS